MNKQSSIEWLRIAYHDLKSAQILYEVNHYTDSIGSDLQQSIEKTLKSLLAFKNKKIPKTHDLYEIYDLLEELIFEEDEIEYLYMATEYYKEDRYPNPNYSLPKREEIKEILDFSERLLFKVSSLLNIKESELKDV